MTSPTDIPFPPAAQPVQPATEAPEPGDDAQLALRRTLRGPNAESWDVVAGDQRIGTVSVQYADGAVEGVLALAGEPDADGVRGILGWVTDLLQLDAAAGPGGMIHWVVCLGEIEDFWRRSPGRRQSGAELDVAGARAQVETVLGTMFEQVATLPDGTYAVDAGSVRVFVAIRQVETTVLVRVFSITNVGVPVDGDLPRFLLGLNFTMALGRFSLDAAQRAVWFDHVLGADDLDDGTLARTIAAVASTADEWDDQIKARFGGRTFREEGSPVEQAATAAGAAGMAGGYL